MNNSMIDAILEKYWIGETSLQEEAQLREFFQNENLNDKYEALRPLFVGSAPGEIPAMSPSAEAKWLKTIEGLEPAKELPGAKVIGMPRRNWWNVAAVALVLILAGSLMYNAITKKEYQEEQLALEAYEETKRALAMVGVHFEKGKDKTAIGLNQASKNLEIITTK